MGLLKSKIFPFLGRVKKFFADSLFFVFRPFGRFRRLPVMEAGAEADKRLVYSLSRSKIPNWNQLRQLKRVLNKKERWAVNFLILFIVLNFVFLGFNFAHGHLRIMPIAGGQYAEGLIGAPARINPLYASLNDVDNDISHLVYSSLFKYGKSGEVEKDLAEDYAISGDGKIYTVKIRGDVKWQHGKKLSADDVIFTFSAIKNPAYNSPLRNSFTGVEISKEDERTVVFKLTEKYAPFLGLLTFGILPSDLWGQIAPSSAALAEFNLKPIGSGPYEFKSLVKDKSGNIKIFNLDVNKNYYGPKPYLKEIVLKFYGDRTEGLNALNENSVDGLSYLPRENKNDLIARNSFNFLQLNLPQLKAIFFNQSKNPFLKDVKTRQALAYAAPKREIIDKVLGGGARTANGPLLDDNFAYNDAIEKYNFDLEKAAALLSEAGWKKMTVTQEDIDALSAKQEAATTSKDVLTDEEKKKMELGVGGWLFREVKTETKTNSTKTKETVPAKKEYFALNLTITDSEEDAGVAALLKENWEKLGIKTGLIVLPAKEIQSAAIKPRAYEALLYTELIGNDPDVYFFWHSSQAGDNGLNLANYKNEEADRMLEEGRLTIDRDERIADYKSFQEILMKDVPAIFLYSPYYTYVQNKKIKGFAVKSISSPADRFTDVTNWYTKMGERLEW